MKNLISQQAVAAARRDGVFKPEDINVITMGQRFLPRPVYMPAPDAALFYPSAGYDLLTPLILSLPYCSQFYFYDHNLANLDTRLDAPYDKVFNYILQIKGIKTSQLTWHESDSNRVLAVEHNKVEKTIYWVREDNLNFLKLPDISLVFYFHRGDSYGEGGSGQFWDSKLFVDLKKRIKPGDKFYYITDGVPGGLSNELINSAKTLPVKESERTYYYGAI